MVDVWSSSLKASILGADTTCCSNWFHILMVLGKKEYMWALTFGNWTRYLMSCPLVPVVAAGIKNGVVGTASSHVLFGGTSRPWHVVFSAEVSPIQVHSTWLLRYWFCRNLPLVSPASFLWGSVCFFKESFDITIYLTASF